MQAASHPGDVARETPSESSASESDPWPLRRGRVGAARPVFARSPRSSRAPPQDPETLPSAPSNHAAVVAWGKTKDAWMALREYPVLSTVMPLTESAAAFALDKTGLPPLEKLDVDYIAPALDRADCDYLDPAIAGLFGHAETCKNKTSEVYAGVSTRVLDITDKVSETVETVKTSVKEKVGLAKAPEEETEEPTEEPSRASL